MRRRSRTFLGLAFIVLAALVVPGASSADTTIHGVYSLPDKTKIERATYHSSTRMRATMFDGNEAIYDSESGEVIVLNHARKRYWRGPLAEANSIVDSLTVERDRPFFEATQEKQKEWIAFTQQFNESIKTSRVDGEKRFAGKRCVGWKMSAGKSVVHTRWLHEELRVPSFTADIYKILLLPALDPVGRAIGRMLLTARQTTMGVILASYTEINTPTQKTRFSWEARRIDTAAIPDSVWAIPEGYEQITF